MLINLTLGGLAVFFIVLVLAFLATKIIIKQTVTGSDDNLIQIEPGMNGEDWHSSDEEDDERNQEMFDDNLEIKKDHIFIIGDGNTDCGDGDFTTKSSDMMRDVRKNLQFSKLFKQKRKEI